MVLLHITLCVKSIGIKLDRAGEKNTAMQASAKFFIESACAKNMADQWFWLSVWFTAVFGTSLYGFRELALTWEKDTITTYLKQGSTFFFNAYAKDMVELWTERKLVCG